METFARPRSIAKTVALAAISLILAGFVTALGIGLRGILWEVKMATAELQKAQAAMQQAQATVAAASKQAEAMVEVARKNAEATVRSAELGNIGDIKATAATNVAIFEPTAKHTEYTMRRSIVENELATGLEYETQRPLRREEIESRTKEIASLQRKIGVVENAVEANISGGLSAFGKAFGGALKTLVGSMDKSASRVANQGSALAQ